MMNEEFIKSIYAAIVEDNLSIYQGLFDRDNNEHTIDYWKNARKLYCEFDENQKEIFYSVIRQVIVDTISNVFGVLDGACSLDDSEWDIRIDINGKDTNSELQDKFLEYVENNESES